MKSKAVILMVITGFLPIFACTNPIMEQARPKEGETPATTVPVTYTVAFESDGGSHVDSLTVAEGEKATRPDNPTKKGYGFVNWYDNEALTEPHYDFDTPVSGDITLFAEWSEIVHTVTFDSGGGSDVDDQEVGENGTASRPTQDPTKEGYTFDDWYGDPELTVLYDFDTPVTGGFTLYAKWTLNTYTVTFMDGDTVLAGLTKTVEHGSTVSRPSDPTKEGHTFDDWYSDPEMNDVYDFETLIKDNTTVYAKFNIKTYTVTFMDGGTVLTGFTRDNAAHGTTVSRPETDPAKDGHTFDDWYSDSEMTAVYDFDTLITDNKTVYAKFNLVPVTYTVTFNSNGGTPQPAPQTLSNGSLVAAVADPSKTFSDDDLYGLEAGLYKNWSGFAFEGWYNGDTKWNFATSAITGNITLTAKWGGSSRNLVPTVAKNDVAAAVTYANNYATATDRFYLLMDGDATTTTAITLSRANCNLTIIGIDEERTISLSYRTTSDMRILFTLDNASASLTLGNNITLLGRDLSSFGSPVLSSTNEPLVRVIAGTFTMENGSKITGQMGDRLHGAVDINGDNAKFYMKGGQITRNRTIATGFGFRPTGNDRRANATTAGVFLYNGLFDMSGGSITDNLYDGTYTGYNRIDYDLRIIIDCGEARNSPHSPDNPSNPQFKLSGDAQIGHIIFTLGNTTDSNSGKPSDTTPHIQLADNFTGSVDSLNFAFLYYSAVNTIQTQWTSLPIRYFITGPGATEANISKFALGSWSAGTYTAVISGCELACDPGNGIYLKAK